MPEYTLTGDDVWKRIESNMERAPDWMPTVIRTHFLTLSPEVVDRMKEAVAENRYMGDLEDSISGEFSEGGYTLTVSPKAQRGAWDAGALLEMGTRPHAAPWSPIAEWAEFRGIPAFAAWYTILTVGTQPHPFLDRTLEESMPQIQEAGRRMAEETANNALFGAGKTGLAP